MSSTKASAESAPAQFTGIVLLVEDNPINQLVASEMLQLLGVEVVAAFDGVEALEHIASRTVDVVLMDIQMPRMDGLEATREIRRREQTSRAPALPVIALTANASDDDRRRCLDAGMDDFIAKPVKTDQLAAVLARYLRST